MEPDNGGTIHIQSAGQPLLNDEKRQSEKRKMENGTDEYQVIVMVAALFLLIGSNWHNATEQQLQLMANGTASLPPPSPTIA